jgi:hypothetical protein
MKLANTTVEVISNVKTQKTAFSFSEDSQDAALAIDVITNKGYKYKIQTPVQEYICNARDAHREIKQTRPIEITIPTLFDPTFKVRDFGAGISPAKMTDVFIKFFSSTKRRDNNQTGGFGLGAKSAFAYTDSFGIVSICDGIKYSYTAYKAGQGMLQPEGEEETQEPDGVTISIAINSKDVEEFKKAVTRATFFWNKDERPKFINNPTPLFAEEPTRYKNLAFYSKSDSHNIFPHNNNKDFVLLDGIPYPLESSEIDSLKVPELGRYDRKVKNFCLVLNTGDISITPFREGLEFNDHTNLALTEKIKDSIQYLSSSHEKELLKAKTIKKKIESIKKYENSINLGTVKLTDAISYENGNLILSLETSDYEKVSFFKMNGEKLKAFTFSRYSRFNLDSEFYEYDPKKDSCSQVIARKKFSQYSKSNPTKECYLLIFGPGSDEIKKKIETGISFKCTSSLIYLKAAQKAREVRLKMSATDLNSGESNQYDLDDEKLEKTAFIYASEYQSEKYEMDRLAKFLTKKGITLLSIFKNDEKHFLNKGAMPMKEELRNVSFTKKEINHFFAHFEGYNYYYITEMEEVFQNQAVLDYIHQLKSLPRESYSYKEKNKEDNHSSYSIYTFKSLMTDNEDYQKSLY